MSATAPTLLHILDPFAAAHDLAWCDHAEIELLSVAHAKAMTDHRHGEAIAIAKRLHQIRGTARTFVRSTIEIPDTTTLMRNHPFPQRRDDVVPAAVDRFDSAKATAEAHQRMAARRRRKAFGSTHGFTNW